MTVSAGARGIEAGFAEPVLDSQEAFRVVLSALSRPGRIERLSRLPEGPAGLAPATAAIALCLFDFDTPVWLDTACDESASEVFLRFHCGCPIVDEPGEAAFAVIGNVAAMPRTSAFNQGDVLYPDTSTTVIVQVPSLDGGPRVVLRGPGIADRQAIAPAGLPGGFWSDWAENRALYPQGVDVLMVSGDAVLGLPRTAVAEAA